MVPPSISRLVDEYLARYKNPATRRHYRQDLAAFVEWCVNEGIEPLEVSAADLDRYGTLYLADELGLAEATLERRTGTVYRFYEHLEERGAIPRHPLTKAERQRRSFWRDKGLAAVASRSTVLQLLAMARESDQVSNALLRLIAVAGARVSEVCELNVDDFSHASSEPHLRIGGRTVVLDADTAEAISETCGDRDDGPVFRTQAGTRAGREWAMRVLRKIAVRAGVERPPTFQALRNFAIVTALAQGSRRQAVADAFGITDATRHDSLADQYRTHTPPVLLNAAAVTGGRDEFTQLLLEVRRLADDDSIHPAAAVALAGATLERYLRTLATQRGVPLPPEKKQTIEVLGNLLIAQKIISAKAKKRVDAIGDLRNDAAHGRFETVTRREAIAIVPALTELLESTLPRLT